MAPHPLLCLILHAFLDYLQHCNGNGNPRNHGFLLGFQRHSKRRMVFGFERLPSLISPLNQ